MVFTMCVASFAVHGSAFDAQKGGMEYPLTLAVMLIALGIAGPGRFTLAALWKRRVPAPAAEAKGETS